MHRSRDDMAVRFVHGQKLQVQIALPSVPLSRSTAWHQYVSALGAMAFRPSGCKHLQFIQQAFARTM